MKNVFCGIALAGFLYSGIAGAQSAQQIATQSLPAPAQQVIERLGQLNRIPDGQWRVHPGDIPHGESSDLDDSGWAAVKPGDEGGTDEIRALPGHADEGRESGGNEEAEGAGGL